MKAEVKKLWVKELRSGKKQQIQGALCNGKGGFCCLGVLSDIHRRRAEDGLKWKDNGSEMDDALLYGKNEDFPPKRVYTWSGLHHTTAERLARMNDTGSTFKDIANYIEKNL